MKFIRKALLVVAMATALVACAQGGRHQEPVVVAASQPAPNLPPAYFGPAYSAAAVYQAITR
jgi:ABC-type glycerol-3-phosphate transport system substrate-binding protein